MINLIKGILAFIAATVVIHVAMLTFGRPPVKVVEAVVERDPASVPTEKYLVEGREIRRKSALKVFEGPLDDRCTESGRKQFVGSLGEYYYHRQNETLRYPEIFGKPGADYIAAQYRSSNDLRIDRLAGEAYRSGHLRPSDFDAVARQMIVAVVSDEKMTGRGCAA